MRFCNTTNDYNFNHKGCVQLTRTEGEATHVQKHRFQNGVRWAKVKNPWPQHVCNLEELGSRLMKIGLMCEILNPMH